MEMFFEFPSYLLYIELTVHIDIQKASLLTHSARGITNNICRHLYRDAPSVIWTVGVLDWTMWREVSVNCANDPRSVQ